MEYKRTYAKAEIDELLAWFEQHESEMKDGMKLGKGQVIKDMKRCLYQLRHLTKKYYDNPNFSGSVTMLFRIKEIHEAQAQQTPDSSNQ